jgi:hypothetical protein
VKLRKFTGTNHSWELFPRRSLLIAGVSVFLVVLGFAGITWTVKGAPGEKYYPTLRNPIALMLAVGWTGFLVPVLPNVIRLDAHRTGRTPTTEVGTQSEESLAARAKELRLRLPLTVEARPSEKLAAIAGSIALLAVLGWGYRIWHPGLTLAIACLSAIPAFETIQKVTFRLSVKSDSFEIRNLWRCSVYGYADLEDVQPAQGGGLMLVLTNHKRIRCYLGPHHAEDIFLILIDRIITQDDR